MLVTTAPQRVTDIEAFWTEPPPEPSPRLLYWLRRFNDGWRPNTRIRTLGYYGNSEYYGVYIWEYVNVIYPTVCQLEGKPQNAVDWPWSGCDNPCPHHLTKR